MKRKALIIGNSGDKNNPKEYLEGVKKDVHNYNTFLQSNIGGKWYQHEIVLSLDENKNQVLKKIEDIKKENNDFIFILFSGHGSYSSWKECRKLYFYDDYIFEDEFINIAKKQLTIFDTCADIENDLILDSAGLESRASLNKYESVKDYRKIYENEILKCLNQQVVLYSSSIAESSNDDSELGGYFTYSLLKVAKKSNQNVLSSKEAYFYAKKIVQERTNNEQNPQCKCIKSENILPFSIQE
ncbi:MAG TPA: caspase family protein [Flavobacteriaceae bacterium]|nr:caspase family protein [Flavobacteriaceae bacterium]